MDVYSFFSGLGSLDLGFEDADFNIAFVNEYNTEFLKAYRYARRKRNFSPKFGYSNNSAVSFLDDCVWDSIFKEQDEEFGFIGGPPCPDFSIAGKNKGFDGENGQLTTAYIDLIIKRKPLFFVFENVKGLYKTKKHRDFYDDLKKRLEEAGFILFDQILNALEYGVPQYRERLVLVGFRKSVFGNISQFQMGNSKTYNIQDITKLSWPNKTMFAEDASYNMPKNIFSQLAVEYWFNKNKVYNHPNAKDVFNVRKLERFTSVLEGDVSRKSFKRLHRWRFSPTAAYGNNEVHLHPYKLRRLSVAESMAIQSLPKWIELPPETSLSAKFKMVGNCVPFLLARGIAIEVKSFLSKMGID